MPGEATFVFLLQTLKEEWREFKDLKDGERREFEQLEEDLETLKALLEDSAEKNKKHEVFIKMERRINDLVYEVEDTIAICLAKKSAAKTKNFISRSAQRFSNDMAKQVKSLRKHKVKPLIDTIESEFVKKIVGDGTGTSSDKRGTEGEKGKSSVRVHEQGESSSQGQSSKQPSNNQDKVVDFGDENTIIEYLLSDPKDELDVISITGIPGIGKTTLARKIFEHEQVVDNFERRIWIGASQIFNSRDVLLSILKQLTPKPTSNSNDDDYGDYELRRTVQACLKEKKMLLVMDDVWTIEAWEAIKEILPSDNKEAKVLVITRDNRVATNANIYRPPHILEGLQSMKSLELMKLRVFDYHERCPKVLEATLQVITSYCENVPLIILVIAGILRGSFSKTKALVAIKEEWEKISKNIEVILNEDKSRFISDAIGLSYNTLAHDLKVCFLYTGLFPKNHEIPASAVTKLWIAEGFVQRKDGESIEETAEKILDDLINKNLLKVDRKDLDQVKTCRVHDMMRTFCIAKATEENFFRVIKVSEAGVLEPPISEVPNFRRLSLHSIPSILPSETPTESRVRSFHCFLEESVDMESSHVSTIFVAFNLLRVLNCKPIKFEEFPNVTRLILLKHITLSIDNLIILPKQITKLLNLQTLIVDTNRSSITVKANIWKMIQLRRFKTKAAIFLDDQKWKDRVSKNFETMSKLAPKSCTTALSQRAPNLKTLGIRGKVANLFDSFSMEEFHHLEKLKLVNHHDSASENPLVGLPQANCFPPTLKLLTLSNTFMKWETDMPILAKINTLKVLKLKENAFTGETWEATGPGFQQLQYLLIENMQLINWNASTTHFPCLRWLVLKRCQRLREVPNNVTSNLEKLEVEYVRRSAVESAKDIEVAMRLRVQSPKDMFVVPFKLILGPGCT